MLLCGFCGLVWDGTPCYDRSSISIEAELALREGQRSVYHYIRQPRALEPIVGTNDGRSPPWKLRLTNELKETDSKVFHYSGNVFMFAVVPESGPLKGGYFLFELQLPDEYPFKPPRVRLLTRALHPGVTRFGADPCCLDVTKDSWSPALTLNRLAASFCAAFTDYSYQDPLNVTVAQLMKSELKTYTQLAATWTTMLAVAPAPWGFWTTQNHKLFPESVKRSIFTLLLIRRVKNWSRDVTMLIVSFVATEDSLETKMLVNPPNWTRLLG